MHNAPYVEPGIGGRPTTPGKGKGSSYRLQEDGTLPAYRIRCTCCDGFGWTPLDAARGGWTPCKPCATSGLEPDA